MLFWEFIPQDFLPPALPKASRIPGVLDSVVVTLALALSSTTVAAILAFFVSLFGSEKVSPFRAFCQGSTRVCHLFAQHPGAGLGIHPVLTLR